MYDSKPSATPLTGALPAAARSAVLALIGTLVLVVGCDSSVSALDPNDDYHYSIYGVLDPAKDTQWVRVESLRGATSGGASPNLDVTVTLENLATNQVWALQDSFMLVEGEMQHNFWTEAPITPSTQYEVVVEGDSAERTSASTTVPDGPPTVSIGDPMVLPCSPIIENNEFGVTLMNVDEVAGLQMKYFQSVFGPPITYRFDHYEDITRESDTTYFAFINYAQDLQLAQRTRDRRCLADSAKVIVTAGGPDWPEFAQYHEAPIVDLTRPDSFSNVKGGHGFVSGVFSTRKTVPIRRREN